MSERETHAAVIAEMRNDANEDEYTPDGILGQLLNCFADRAEVAHKRELDDLRKSLGDSFKLRETVESCLHAFKCTDWTMLGVSGRVVDLVQRCNAALDAPPRNCERFRSHSEAIEAFEKWMDFSPKTAHEEDDFFREHWFEFAIWLVDMHEGEGEEKLHALI